MQGNAQQQGKTSFAASCDHIDAISCPTVEVAERLADRALYDAKGQGRYRAVLAEAPLSAFADVELS